MVLKDDDVLAGETFSDNVLLEDDPVGLDDTRLAEGTFKLLLLIYQQKDIVIVQKCYYFKDNVIDSYRYTLSLAE